MESQRNVEIDLKVMRNEGKKEGKEKHWSTEVKIKAAIKINIICRIIMKHVISFSSDKIGNTGANID